MHICILRWDHTGLMVQTCIIVSVSVFCFSEKIQIHKTRAQIQTRIQNCLNCLSYPLQSPDARGSMATSNARHSLQVIDSWRKCWQPLTWCADQTRACRRLCDGHPISNLSYADGQPTRHTVMTDFQKGLAVSWLGNSACRYRCCRASWRRKKRWENALQYLCLPFTDPCWCSHKFGLPEMSQSSSKHLKPFKLMKHHLRLWDC